METTELTGLDKGMKKKTNWGAILGISAVGLCMICCLAVGLSFRFAPDLYRYYLSSSSLNVGDVAPDFELIALDGEPIRLSDFKGKPVLLSFGATWCPSCRLEAPLVQQVHETHPELIVLLVDSQEDANLVREFAEEFGITHAILLDRDGSVSRQYQIFAIPTGLFIDAEGVIQAKLVEQLTPELLAEKLPLIGIHELRLEIKPGEDL